LFDVVPAAAVLYSLFFFFFLVVSPSIWELKRPKAPGAPKITALWSLSIRARKQSLRGLIRFLEMRR
jgi:hypothetical protein